FLFPLLQGCHFVVTSFFCAFLPPFFAWSLLTLLPPFRALPGVLHQSTPFFLGIPHSVDPAFSLLSFEHPLPCHSLDRPPFFSFLLFHTSLSASLSPGDFKSNSEYHAALEQQGFFEFLIKDLSPKLSHAQVIYFTKHPTNGRVLFFSPFPFLPRDTASAPTSRVFFSSSSSV
ncbi:hypothetical protein GEP12_23610, partial [Salmonella enterica subsp. enterica serovar Anatum]|nr:hypothetical protein [Salmonella enterica subsp. enterica serovar Anatum]